MKFRNIAVVALLASCAIVAQSHAAIYTNGFEVNDVDWSGVTRVPSGTNGITSATGSFHAEATAGAFTRWGGYNFGAGNAVPTAFQAYTTKLDIFLNVGGGFANDARFDYSSAINNSLGTHLRDFVFTGGFYNSADVTGPGAGTNRFVFSASNTTPGWPKDPGRSPFAISSTGWYTFEHSFYNNSGVLAADLTIYDKSTNTALNTWTLSNPLDLIGGVGGNRYGWFVTMDTSYGFLAIDNAEMRTADNGVVPEPMTLAVWSVLGLCGSAIAWRSRFRAEG